MIDRRILFMSVGVLILSIVLSALILHINKDKLLKINNEISVEKQKDELITEMLIAKKQTEKYRTLFAQTDDVSWFLDEIHNMVEATQLDLDFMEPQDKIKKKLFVKVPVALGCSATFEELARFISLVEGFPKYLFIDELKITQLPVAQGKDDEVLFENRYDVPKAAGFYLDKPRAFIKVATIVPYDD